MVLGVDHLGDLDLHELLLLGLARLSSELLRDGSRAEVERVHSFIALGVLGLVLRGGGAREKQDATGQAEDSAT